MKWDLAGKRGKGEAVRIYAMKAHSESGDIAAFILNVSTRCSWVVSYTLWDRGPGNYLTEAGPGGTQSLGFWRRNISFPCRYSNPGSSSPQPTHCTVTHLQIF